MDIINNTASTLHTLIEEKLQTVYDPEFPMVDIFTLGLIYDIKIQEEEKIIDVLMTFTTAACPMAEMLQEMVRNAVMEVAPEYQIALEVTFDPMRTIDMIKDEDLKRMFE
jgi:metal-sulfur cluster biosynthetic enzyme